MTRSCRVSLAALVAAVSLVAALPVQVLALQAPATPQAAVPQVPVDPQTGRAIGAKEMAPDVLRALIDRKAPVIIIDVRDEAQFVKETITGAVHIPFADLEARLKDIPKDTILAFT